LSEALGDKTTSDHEAVIASNFITLWGIKKYVAAEWFSASDESDLQACNQYCLCGVWVRSHLAALDMLHRIKGIFGAYHVPVVSFGHSSFLHHQN
jgi:hypothetical protein